MTAIKGEINNSTIIVADFNTPLTEMDRSFREKIKETQALNDVLDEVVLRDIYRTFHLKAEDTHCFQVHMKHSSG